MTDLVTDLGGVPTLFVMAAEAEYGPALKSRFTPLMTGIGPIEAALAMGMALTRLQTEGRLPRLVVSLGSAGSARLEQGAIYQAASVSWRSSTVRPPRPNSASRHGGARVPVCRGTSASARRGK